MDNFFELYDAIWTAMVDDAEDKRIIHAETGRCWSMVECEDSLGMAMADSVMSRAAMFESGFEGLSLKEAAAAIKSWNLNEASKALAAANAYFNTSARIEALNCSEPYENYSTAGLSFDGATVAAIGHLHLTEEIHRVAKDVYIIERAPKDGDYPDAACDYILPRCDYVFITGSALINKTLPHLLSLCKNAYTILTGPSVPLCPALLDFGIDRLAGMAIANRDAMREHINSGRGGNPYSMGQTFLLKK